jgi:hypothetical protein
MALFPLGILSAAGAGGVGGTYELIQTQILGSSTPSITFSSLGDYASTYKHLQLRATYRTTSDTYPAMRVRLNGDTGANYSRHGLYGDGSAVSSFGFGNINQMEMGESISTGVSGNFTVSVADFLDAYSSTKNTTMRSMNGYASADSLARILIHSGAYYNTASITSMVLFFGAGDIIAGSRFSLYGIR